MNAVAWTASGLGLVVAAGIGLIAFGSARWAGATQAQMAGQLTAGLGTPIRYESPSLWHFYRTLRRDGREPGLILVMLLLHMLPRFTGTPPVTHTVADLTGRARIEFAQFVAAHRDELLLSQARP